MNTPQSSQRGKGQRGKGLTLAVLMLAAAGALYAWWDVQRGHGAHRAPVRAVMAPPVAEPLPAIPAPAAPAGVRPSFDVVRVSPNGSTVIAGRAAAGSEVVVFDGDRVVARATADRRGEFVALPAAPLPAGGRELTLAARSPASGTELRSEQSVVVVVPDTPRPGAAAPAPVVALLDPRGGARILQEPDAAKPASGKRTASLDVVDYDDAGAVRFSGRAAAGAAVRLYVDNAAMGDAQADAAGRWNLVPGLPVAPGMHTLRLDTLDAAGRVTARAEQPFQRTATAALQPGQVVVQPGQNLWRLARAAYGNGTRYTVIYQANQAQIRNPQLIYPGQAFAVPPGESAAP